MAEEHGPGDPTICFVIPYFGHWPFWFPFFLESCRSNPGIHWILHSDCGIPENAPPNVTFVETSFDDYCRQVSSALGIDFAPTNPYKLCDLKPALGLVHQEELKKYDFWAFGDLDLVYGNLRNYFSAERLARKDIFSTHRRRISGHLCLIRNTLKMRSAFMTVPNWKQLLENKDHVAFDESAFSRLFVRHKNWPDWLSNLAKPFNAWTRRTENVEAFSTPNAGLAWIDGSRNFPENWYWIDGTLTNDRDGSREFPYLHFLGWKQSAWKSTEIAGKTNARGIAQSRRWRIANTGFHQAG